MPLVYYVRLLRATEALSQPSEATVAASSLYQANSSSSSLGASELGALKVHQLDRPTIPAVQMTSA